MVNSVVVTTSISLVVFLGCSVPTTGEFSVKLSLTGKMIRGGGVVVVFLVFDVVNDVVVVVVMVDVAGEVEVVSVEEIVAVVSATATVV